MSFSKIHLLFVGSLLILLCSAFAAQVSHDGRAITIDGQRKLIISGSIHYPRSTVQMWQDLIKKAKEGGLNAIETYVFWNAHEPLRRQYDFSGNHDLIRFLKTIEDQGLYAILRIGPYVCAEWNYGGFPVWLHNVPDIEMRTANSVFMNEMQNFTSLIVDMVKKESLFASQGGPIILAQIENEYGNVISSYGDAGKAYLNWCASMAESLDVGVPWIMCQESDAPEPMLNTCNGYYCDQFTPDNPNTPKIWTENWTGWFKNWGGLDPHRTAEDVAFAVARFYQNGGAVQNYYMYHGGTNFGRTAGGPYITTTYDYDAPLNEYGSPNQPKYGHLTQLHNILMSMEKTLTYGNITNTDYGNSLYGTVYTLDNTSSCFFGNANETSDATVNYQGVDYNVPAWSVSILPDCKTEVYNTAKLNTQTNLMVKKSNEAEDEPASLKWSWRPEINLEQATVQGKGQVSTNMIVDQKVANDVSDYLWYMPSVKLDKDDPIWTDDMSIRVNATGHILHVYINGEYLGSQWATYGVTNYVFEKKVKLNPGMNQITLLSATIGFQNYGPKFDVVQAGISGPVEIIGRKGDETIIKDLSSHKWSYKVGLHGLDNKIYSSDGKFTAPWNTEDLPINRMLTWYKTTFKAPLGEDPIALDMQGLGKGVAWVNGNSIGRYWPSYMAEDDGCSTDVCDYRGSYYSSKCDTNCGQPTQRWYHVPRSFINDDVNELVLFEEFGGNPTLVNFQTIRVGTACGIAYENKEMELSCQGRPISAIKFASFGDVQGACGSYENGSCTGRNDALSIVQNACVGKESCTVTGSESIFGAANCADGISKKLIVEALC
ncbi:beta-galactosidase 15-like [Olea europaea var. sylvestris]|uniref:beta-galactosidase 15-like n=1 Tax=Olea europaea var. sylvestris TaxID=158386 RepID=UPI000C1D0971|nr:beta-galactosidase 15-like [Olea europaea var. sylvestris]